MARVVVLHHLTPMLHPCGTPVPWPAWDPYVNEQLAVCTSHMPVVCSAVLICSRYGLRQSIPPHTGTASHMQSGIESFRFSPQSSVALLSVEQPLSDCGISPACHAPLSVTPSKHLDLPYSMSCTPRGR